MNRKLCFIAFVAGLSGIAAPALALEPKQCLPMAEMNAALKADGQRTLLIGDRMDYEGQVITFAGTSMTRAEWRDLNRDLGADTEMRRSIIAKSRREGKTNAQIDALISELRDVASIFGRKGDPKAPVPRLMNAFLSNTDGSVAYNLEGNKPADQISTRACIRARFTDVRLARRSQASGNETTDIFVGRGVFPDGAGGTRAGATASLRGSIRSGEAALMILLPNEQTQTMFYMEGVRLTPFGLSVLQD